MSQTEQTETIEVTVAEEMGVEKRVLEMKQLIVSFTATVYKSRSLASDLASFLMELSTGMDSLELLIRLDGDNQKKLSEITEQFETMENERREMVSSIADAIDQIIEGSPDIAFRSRFHALATAIAREADREKPHIRTSELVMAAMVAANHH